jgi:uncharacterized membrane protein
MNKETVKGLVGSVLGLIIAILILTIGFWKTLLLVALAALGWWLSGARQLPQGFYDLLARIKFPWD